MPLPPPPIPSPPTWVDAALSLDWLHKHGCRLPLLDHRCRRLQVPAGRHKQRRRQRSSSTRKGWVDQGRRWGRGRCPHKCRLSSSTAAEQAAGTAQQQAHQAQQRAHMYGTMTEPGMTGWKGVLYWSCSTAQHSTARQAQHACLGLADSQQSVPQTTAVPTADRSDSGWRRLIAAPRWRCLHPPTHPPTHQPCM